ncbi:MAG: Fur family transcriptional regulator [Dehalococcoidia bacterium]|nr:Fur family transcriptional regulator [Dehalococcoidia bacterium]
MNGNQLPGQRMTSQRKLLFDIICQAEGHLDADELHQRARESGLRISLSTVYRNLQLFKKSGLVTERHFAEDHHYYETKNSSGHSHLVCHNCGMVFEVKTLATEELRLAVEKEACFQISDIEINVRGYCRECQGKRPNEE